LWSEEADAQPKKIGINKATTRKDLQGLYAVQKLAIQPFVISMMRERKRKREYPHVLALKNRALMQTAAARVDTVRLSLILRCE